MVEQVVPQNKVELLNEIQREWNMLIFTIEKLTPEQMVTPDAGGWSPKDNIAHLSEWMKILLGYYFDKRPAAEVTGLDPQVIQRWDYNEVNRCFFERNKNRMTEEVFDELKLVYAEVVGRLESISFETLLQPCFVDDPKQTPLLAFVLGNTSEHFAEHCASIEKVME